MVEVDVFEEIKNNFTSELGEKYSFDVILEVWERITQLIINYLQRNKSVILKNLGTFSLCKWSLETGIGRELKHFQPVFKLSNTLLEHFDLHQSKQYIDDKVPVAPVTYCELAKECHVDKECVLYALQRVTETLWKILYRKDDVRLDFPTLGTLFIRNEIVQFQFTTSIIPVNSEPRKYCWRLKAAQSEYHQQNIVPCKYHRKH